MSCFFGYWVVEESVVSPFSERTAQHSMVTDPRPCVIGIRAQPAYTLRAILALPRYPPAENGDNRRKRMKEGRMSEERPVHPREPAEGSEEDVGAPGADRAGDDRRTAEGEGEQAETSAHPQEPVEGSEADVGAPGADRSGDGS
jgi:hypothetical protein